MPSSQPRNEVSLSPEGYVYVVYRGDQTADSVSQTAGEAAAKLDEMRKAGLRMRSLIDMSEVGAAPTSARKAGLEAMKDVRDAKTAIIGAPKMIQHVIQFIVRVARKEPILLFFDDEAAGKRWLLQEP
jgi:arginine/ornithine N-succinyltransferase beta subunit